MDEIRRQKVEIKNLLACLEGAVRDMEGAGGMLGEKCEELCGSAREGEAILSSI